MQEMSRLLPVSYYDSEEGILLSCFADTVVYHEDGSSKTLVAIRFGGYPEQVKGLSDAVYGGGTLESKGDNCTTEFDSVQKQYRCTLSHDGIYAEAMLVLNDDQAIDVAVNGDDEQKDLKKSEIRRQFIFCEKGNKTALFEEVDKKTAIPLISEFTDFVISELINRKSLVKLTVLSQNDAGFDAWMLMLRQDEQEMIDIINSGLKSKQITIPGSRYVLGSSFDDVQTVTQYLNRFGVVVANRIKNTFSPLFDPSTEEICDKLKKINGYLYKKVGYSLYPAQLAVAEAVKRRLDKSKVATIIAECGSGKTKIGAVALASHQKHKSFNVVLCPSHVSKKWVREIHETLPDTFAMVVKSLADVDKLYKTYKKENKTAYLIVSKERARDGYMKRPAVNWSNSRRCFICPDCGEKQEMKLTEDGVSYDVAADHYHYKKENDKNHKCDDCGSVLWTAINPSDYNPKRNQWVKIGGYGFVHRKFARRHFEKVFDKKLVKKIAEIAELGESGGIIPTAGAYRRYGVSTYIKDTIGTIDGLIVDEFHQYKGDSGQGAAMAELIGVTKKMICMTATLISGYSSGLFFLLYRTMPHMMQIDGKEYQNQQPFNTEYGVTESVYEVSEAEFNANKRAHRKKIREKQLPGVSPLVYSRFLIDSSAFLSLNDMGKQLPDYEEIPIELEMNEAVKEEYDSLAKQFKNIMMYDRKVAKRLLSRYLGLLSVYPDQPYGHEPIYHPDYKKLLAEDSEAEAHPLVAPKNTSEFSELHEKDLAVLDIVEQKIENGERVMIYTNWIRIDTQDKLTKILSEIGYKVDTLTAKVAPEKREEWVEKRVDNGLQILITNPSLVETGLDLNAFTTLIYYNIGYNIFTFRQSSRRSWRINQTAPKVEVYILYYKGTMQARAIKLMASKLAVATIIEGNLSDEGLAAMSECQDMTTLLAKELTLGIRDEVEDIAETFKKMAIIKTDTEEDENLDDYMIIPDEPVRNIISKPVKSPIVKNTQADKIRVSDKVRKSVELVVAASAKSKGKKSNNYVENQITLFDLIA